MHGLVNRAIEEFTRVTYGDALWSASAEAAGADPRGFVLMRRYEAGLTLRLMDDLASRLSRTRDELAEDVGAWVAGIPSIRRLLRFAGPDYDGFMMALPELRDRALMIVGGFSLPQIALRHSGQGWIVTAAGEPVWLHAISGMLHAMADDYGVLAVIAVEGREIHVSVPLAHLTAGRPFSICDPAIGA